MKQSTGQFIFIGFAILVCMLGSCDQKQIIDLPTQDADSPEILSSPEQETQTLQPDPEPTPSTQNIATSISDDIQPQTGAILLWMDQSSFVYIPAGDFSMGADEPAESDHSPTHTVHLESFWIHQNEVTNQQYAQCVADGKCSPPVQEADMVYRYSEPQNANFPVVGVTWFQAQDYCLYIDSRLPTEAEWEKAARGMDGQIDPWGDEIPSCDRANLAGCQNPPQPVNVGSNENGQSNYYTNDMVGNVFEWVNDWYSEDYYASSPADKPLGAEQGAQKVTRGGSFAIDPDETNMVNRYSNAPENHASDVGFRCVLMADPAKSPSISIAQPCSVLPVNVVPETYPTNTPYPCAPVTVKASCEWMGPSAQTTIKIQQKGCLGGLLQSISANAAPLKCDPAQLSSGDIEYTCSRPDLYQGSLVELGFCYENNLRPLVKTCPIGYRYDQSTLLCETMQNKLPSSPCPEGYLDTPLYGCLPIIDEIRKSCPVGFYTSTFQSSPICMPLNEKLLSNFPDTDQNAACSTGSKYNANESCCEPSSKQHLFCQAGFRYYAAQNVCINVSQNPNNCAVQRTVIPNCVSRFTPTPNTTPAHNPSNNCRRVWDPIDIGWDIICD